jgi:hypothetical protein
LHAQGLFFQRRVFHRWHGTASNGVRHPWAGGKDFDLVLRFFDAFNVLDGRSRRPT